MSSLKRSIFPQKLWRMLDERQFHAAIRWTEDGKSFYVFENQLMNLCLGKENHIFYTRQPKSFVRQLHLYGFRKINKNQFMHPQFQRDRPGLVRHIKRSYRQSHSKGPADGCLLHKEDHLSPEQHRDNHSVTAAHSGESSSSVPSTPAEVLRTKNNHQVQQVGADDRAHSSSPNRDHSHFQLINVQLEHSDNQIVANNRSTNGAAALVFNNNYEEICPIPSSWVDSGIYVDLTTNYNEDSILTLYNNDIYPNISDDNNITL